MGLRFNEARNSAERRSTVAVIGLGNIGGIVAGSLCAADRHDVIACSRHRVDRFQVDCSTAAADVSPSVALTDPACASPVDWVLLCTKTYDSATAAPWLHSLCDDSSVIAVLQNGVDHVERIGPYVPDPSRVLPAIVYFNGERLARDRFRYRPAGDCDIAVPQNALGQQFRDIFDGSFLRVALFEDFTTLIWRKLLLNAIGNPLTALTGQRQAIFRRPDIEELCRAILREAVTVATAEEARLGPDEVDRAIATLLAYPPDAGTSMYFDRLAGRPLEFDALTGAIVRAGERHGIATPVNRALLTVLRTISESATSGPKSSVRP
jgi:2-dehydropantoate 2-reductase